MRAIAPRLVRRPALEDGLRQRGWKVQPQTPGYEAWGGAKAVRVRAGMGRWKERLIREGRRGKGVLRRRGKLGRYTTARSWATSLDRQSWFKLTPSAFASARRAAWTERGRRTLMAPFAEAVNATISLTGGAGRVSINPRMALVFRRLTKCSALPFRRKGFGRLAGQAEQGVTQVQPSWPIPWPVPRQTPTPAEPAHEPAGLPCWSASQPSWSLPVTNAKAVQLMRRIGTPS